MTISPTTPPSFGSALAGMQQAERGLDLDAATIASAGPDVDALVDLDVRRASFAANVAVLRTADEIARDVLDVFA